MEEEKGIQTRQEFHQATLLEIEKLRGQGIYSGTAVARMLDGTRVPGLPRWASPVAKNWLNEIEERTPLECTNTPEWREMAALTAATSWRDTTAQLRILQKWVWQTVAPSLQEAASLWGMGYEWRQAVNDPTPGHIEELYAMARQPNPRNRRWTLMSAIGRMELFLKYYREYMNRDDPTQEDADRTASLAAQSGAALAGHAVRILTGAELTTEETTVFAWEQMQLGETLQKLGGPGKTGAATSHE